MRRRHGFLIPGDKVKVFGKTYVAVPNLPQIFNRETNCVGCAFCLPGGACDHALLNKQKNFHCGNIEDTVENQILLKEVT